MTVPANAVDKRKTIIRHLGRVVGGLAEFLPLFKSRRPGQLPLYRRSGA